MLRNRETATHPRVAQRDTRFVDSEVNKYDRIVFAGAQSERFQILYRVRGGLMKPQGSYVSLAEAIQARDAGSVYAPQGCNAE